MGRCDFQGTLMLWMHTNKQTFILAFTLYLHIRKQTVTTLSLYSTYYMCAVCR